MDTLNVEKLTDKRNELTVPLLEHYFDLIIAHGSRTQIFPTVVFLKLMNLRKNEHIHSQRVHHFFSNELRDSDLFTQISYNEWAFVLMDSGEVEAEAFVKRLVKSFQSQGNLNIDMTFSVCISVVCKKVGFQEIIQESQLVLDEVPINDEINILHNLAYADRETKQVKLSLIESDPILVRVLENIVKNLEIEYVHLEIKVFQDGYEFLQSDWFTSGHEHILILNEIMPKMNAYDVLNYLSKQPNFKKYRVFMFTNRTFNDHLMDTYSIGIDDYLTKPFNIDLFKARLKKLIKRA